MVTIGDNSIRNNIYAVYVLITYLIKRAGDLVPLFLFVSISY